MKLSILYKNSKRNALLTFKTRLTNGSYTSFFVYPLLTIELEYLGIPTPIYVIDFLLFPLQFTKADVYGEIEE